MSDRQGASGRFGLFLLGVASLCLFALLPGCAELRRVAGMDRVGPDEFAVESRAPLTIPPDYDLRPPQPGAVRPQETTAAERARKAIDTAGPGEPGKQATFALRASERRAEPLDPAQQAERGLSDKLLGYNAGEAGAAVEKRETTPVKGIY